MPDSAAIIRTLRRNVDSIVGEPDLRERLDSGRQLRIKYGVDCTAPDLHIGHAVNLWMMRQLQAYGHRVVFLLGDVTTAIGDPTGKSETRPVLPAEQIEANAAAFLDQISFVLDTDPAVFETRRNSEWYGAMSVAELLRLFSLVTHAQLMGRDMFRERVALGREIALHELTYPVLQGYDSFALVSDLTIVGSDQLFNEMMGRHYQQRLGMAPQVVVTTRITPGLDGGPKQSKSLNNYISLTDTPENKFGKVMTLPDGLVGTFAEAYTELSMDRVRVLADRAAGGGTAARDAKLALAQAIVERYHGDAEAQRRRASFTRIFSEGLLPDDVPELRLPRAGLTVLELVRLARPDSSNSDRRRLIAQGGVRLDERRLTDPAELLDVSDGAVLRAGRRTWLRCIIDRDIG